MTSISSLQSIMGIWAHPDDEVFSMGGIMAQAAKNGQSIVCITATRGEAGVQDEKRWPVEKLAQIRSLELENAYRVLGVSEHEWLDYADGECSQVDEKLAVARIVRMIQHYKPDSIFTFGPDGLTGHDDHKAVARWSRLACLQLEDKPKLFNVVQTNEQYEALKQADKLSNIFFNIDRPLTYDAEDCDLCYQLPEEVFQQKVAALKCMPSQTESLLNNVGNNIRLSFGVEAFINAK